ncbi:MAG: acetolactate synthase small subunit [Dysgonamonadaceae bacterium]|nr:acetolactate synthase small subunit [Dysgonamonadaceae bacterium]
MQEKTFYTITVFSENTVGVLNQITTIFTRRQLNIESLSVSPSAIDGIHKFTITTFLDSEEAAIKLVKQIDKRVDVLKAYFNTDEELVYQEIALYKIETAKLVATSNIEKLVRKYNARILDVSDHSTIIQKTGHYEETQALFEELSESIGVLQFIRSGRVAITKSRVERLSDMIERRRLIDESNK